MPARSRAVAVTLCWPSARLDGGVYERRPAVRLAATAVPSSLRLAVPGVVSMPLPGCGSASWMLIAGRPLFVQLPSAGLLATSTGGIVSRVVKLDVKATVWRLPLASSAPFSVTV